MAMEFKVAAKSKEDGTSSSSFIDKASSGLLNKPPSVRRMCDNVSGSFDVSDALMTREIEKRRMREEILMSEILRRRELKAEVMRELMLEREIALRTGKELPLLDSHVSMLRSGSLLTQFKSSVLGLPEFKDMVSLAKHPDAGVGGESPFHRQPGPGVKNGFEIKPVIDLSKGKTISVKPMNSSVAGKKRKFETGFTTGTDEGPPVSLSRKLQREWSCPLCQVKATSEQGLKDHLKGKKHKAKERALRRSKRTLGNSSSNSDPVAKETRNSIDHAMCSGGMSPYLSSRPKEKEKEKEEENTKIVQQTEDPKEKEDEDMQIVQQAEDPKEKEEEDIVIVQQAEDMELVQQAEDIEIVQQAEDLRNPIGETTTMLKSTNFKFWCKLCNFGTPSEELMTAHRMGKNHLTLSLKNGGCVIAIENMPANVQHVDETKDTTAKEGKDETLEYTELDLDGEGAVEEENENTTLKEGKNETVEFTDSDLDGERAVEEEKENTTPKEGKNETLEFTDSDLDGESAVEEEKENTTAKEGKGVALEYTDWNLYGERADEEDKENGGELAIVSPS